MRLAEKQLDFDIQADSKVVVDVREQTRPLIESHDKRCRVLARRTSETRGNPRHSDETNRGETRSDEESFRSAARVLFFNSILVESGENANENNSISYVL